MHCVLHVFLRDPHPNVQVDDLDYAIRKKSPEKATAAYAEAKSALKEALAALG